MRFWHRCAKFLAVERLRSQTSDWDWHSTPRRISKILVPRGDAYPCHAHLNERRNETMRRLLSGFAMASCSSPLPDGRQGGRRAGQNQVHSRWKLQGLHVWFCWAKAKGYSRRKISMSGRSGRRLSRNGDPDLSGAYEPVSATSTRSSERRDKPGEAPIMV